MTRREFLTTIPGTVRQVCARILPEPHHLGWVKRIVGGRGHDGEAQGRVATLDGSRCPACGDIDPAVGRDVAPDGVLSEGPRAEPVGLHCRCVSVSRGVRDSSV